MTHSEILEIGKFMSDLFALVTTLDTGMVGIIIAVVEKVFTTERVLKSPGNKNLFIASLFSPILSLFFSIMALMSIRSNVVAMMQGGTSSELVNPFFFYGSFIFFFIGVFCFVLLALRVLISSPITGSEEEHEQSQKSAIRKTTKRR